MRTIYKYPLAIAEYQEVKMPEGARILSVQMQRNYMIENNQAVVSDCCVWAEVDTTRRPLVYREFVMVGTGHELPHNNDTFAYIATVQDGRFVWHVYYR